MPVDYAAFEASYSESYGSTSGDMETEKEWARLVAEPKFRERCSYRIDVITKQLSNLSFVCLVICLMSPIAIIANFENDLGPVGEYTGFVLSLSFLGLGFFVDKILNRDGHSTGATKRAWRDKLDSILDWIFVGLFLAIALIVIQTMGASISGGFAISYQEFSGLQIPIPNNPLISGILVVLFWQARGALDEKSNLASQRKSNFHKALKSLDVNQIL